MVLWNNTSYINFVTASYGKYKPQGTATIEFATDAWKFA